MTSPVRLPAQIPAALGGIHLSEAVLNIRGRIESYGHEYICIAASHMYSWTLRLFLQEIMRDCGIRVDGRGFNDGWCPDWLCEFKDERERRLYFLDCLIAELRMVGL